MKQKAFILVTLLITSVFAASSQGKRLPYVLQKGATVCDTIYTLPDEKAGFAGGTSAMYDFFKQNLKHSEELTNINFTRRLTLQLLVDDKGKIVRSEVLTSLSQELDRDALIVARKIPQLVPAKMGERNVCSYLIIPLFFK